MEYEEWQMELKFTSSYLKYTALHIDDFKHVQNIKTKQKTV